MSLHLRVPVFLNQAVGHTWDIDNIEAKMTSSYL